MNSKLIFENLNQLESKLQSNFIYTFAFGIIISYGVFEKSKHNIFKALK